MGEFVPGLYDQLINELFGEDSDRLELQRLRAAVESVDPAEISNRVGEVVGLWAASALSTVSSEDRSAAAIRLSAALLDEINRLHPDAVNPQLLITEPVQRLTAIERLQPAIP